jgi:hypothetical protein
MLAALNIPTADTAWSTAVDRKIKRALTDNLALPRTVSLVLGTGEYAVYQGIRAGNIPHIKVGRKLMVPTAPLRRMLGLGGEGPKAA